MPPRILCSSSKDGFENYAHAIRAAGGEAFGGYCPALDLSYDGLLLCGGGDIAPARYGQENCGSQPPDLDRDEAEFALARAYLEAGKPILGICRGHQLLNVLLGGTLIQDVGEAECRTHLGHIEGGKGIDKVHTIRAEEGSLLHRLYGGEFSVNSYHHQVVDRLGAGLRITACGESGLPEAVEHDTLPLVCVQYHPERMTAAKRRPDTVDGALLLQAFVDLCRAE